MKILIIRLSGMREILLTTPVVRCLHKQLPGSEIHYLVNHAAKDVINSNPYIHQCHDLQFSRETQLEELRKIGFDGVIDLQQDAASKYITDGLGAPSKASGKASIIQTVFKTFSKWLSSKAPLEKQYFERVAYLGVKDDAGGLEFFIPKDAHITYRDIPASHHAGFIALAIGDTALTAAELEKLKALCAAIQHPIVLIGDKKEATIGEAIREGEAIKVYNACGKFSFGESADLLEKAKLVITPESGWLYMAAALKKQMVVLSKKQNGIKNITPLYNKSFLKNLNETPFDTVPFFTKEAGEKTVIPIINTRLNRKA